jgi:tRNA G46 methylase TrmB
MYPNPYPKKSDLNKRWHAMPFMGRLLEVLRPQGEITLVTNERFYFEEARAYYLRNWGLQSIEEITFVAKSVPGGLPRTHFEKKYLARGQECFQLRVRKVGSLLRE